MENHVSTKLQILLPVLRYCPKTTLFDVSNKKTGEFGNKISNKTVQSCPFSHLCLQTAHPQVKHIFTCLMSKSTS